MLSQTAAATIMATILAKTMATATWHTQSGSLQHRRIEARGRQLLTLAHAAAIIHSQSVGR